MSGEQGGRFGVGSLGSLVEVSGLAVSAYTRYLERIGDVEGATGSSMFMLDIDEILYLADVVDGERFPGIKEELAGFVKFIEDNREQIDAMMKAAEEARVANKKLRDLREIPPGTSMGGQHTNPAPRPRKQARS